MEDSPRIVILGAGPIGIEAALYARYLGFSVQVVDAGDIADNVRTWGHLRMFTPFRGLRSTLGLAALNAQSAGFAPPPDDALLAGHEWRDQYLVPLAHTDLVADSLQLQTRAVSVARLDFLKQDAVGNRSESPFRVLVERGDGREDELLADTVLDCTGVFNTPNWLGRGGAPALGERASAKHIHYYTPDLLGDAQQDFAGKRVLVVGAGESAATSIAALVELRRNVPATSITWVTRRSPGDDPVRRIPADPYPERVRVTEVANQSVALGQVDYRPETLVQQLARDPATEEFTVWFSNTEEPQCFDRVIANTGYRSDQSLHEELQVEQHYTGRGIEPLAAARRTDPARGCTDPVSYGPQSLVCPEAGYFVLGAKSYGRSDGFLFETGLLQIRDAFTVIGERESLDLYRTASSG